jgi:hypothetical protein
MRVVRVVVSTTAVVATLTWPSPAVAKSFDLHRVTVQGPGLGEGRVIDRVTFGSGSEGDPPVAVLEGLVNGPTSSRSPSHGPLGPGYLVVYELDLVFRDDLATILQVLYPFAAGGPAAWTPEGQVWRPLEDASYEPIPPGWQMYPAEMALRLLVCGSPLSTGGPPARFALGFDARMFAGLAGCSKVAAKMGNRGAGSDVPHADRQEEVGMRRAIVAATGALALLALALPAQAKVTGTAHISGPGVGGGPGGGMRMGGDDGMGYPLMSGLFDPAGSRTARPEGDLGPRYRVRFVIDVPRGESPIIQHLYPFAQGGPVLHTPAGQEWIWSDTGQVPAGWFAAAPELITELQDRGLPQRSPVHAGETTDRPLATPTVGPSPILLIVGIAAALLVAAAAAGRRRAAVRPVHRAS